MEETQAPGKEAIDRATVIRKEREWHEKENIRREPLDKILYEPPAFDKLVDRGLAFLQADRGQLILDLGCGEGRETVEMAARGLRVIGVDLAHAQLSRAQEMLRGAGQEAGPGTDLLLVQANAEELPFAAGSFHIVYGKAILHHLDHDLVFEELDRILREEGRATFAEPMDRHPLFTVSRRLTPDLRTADERPVSLQELRDFARRFHSYDEETFFLTAPLAYGFRLLPGGEAIFRPAHAFLQKVDYALFRLLPFLRKFTWYGMITLSKSGRR